MTRIDEFSSGYDPAPKAVAAAVKPHAEMTSCAFKMMHDLVPPLPPALSPPPDLFPWSHQQQLPLQLVHTSEESVSTAQHRWTRR